MKLTVSVATYQQVGYIREALESVLRQRTSFPFEIVVGDDGSSDGTREVLAEIGASDVPARLVLNKCDCITAEAREALERRYPDAFFCSARLPEDVARLRAHIIGFFEDRYVDAEVLVPYDRQAVVARMHDEAKVVSQDYREDGVLVVLRGDADTVARLRRGLE